MARRCAVLDCRSVKRRAIFVEPCNRVGAQNGRERRRVGRFACHGSDRWAPPRELVVVLRRRCLCRRCVARRLVVCHISRIDDGAVVILPCDGVFVYRRVVFGGVGRLARHRRDFGIPARERVGELRRRGLYRRCAAVGRRRAVEDVRRAKRCAVFVLPRHVVRAERSRVFGGIRRVGGNQLEIRFPASEVEIILRRRRLCRQRAVVDRHRASRKVGVRLERRAVRVLPCHRVRCAVRRGYDDILDPATVLA